jgi:hypothetical protein
MATCFCPLSLIFQGPTGYTYSGYYCIDGQAQNGTYKSSTPLTNMANPPGDDGSCTCVEGVCIPIATLTAPPTASAHSSSNPSHGSSSPFATIYARGVPNPHNTLSQPDEFGSVAVIGDYTADVTLGDQHLSLRLLVYALEIVKGGKRSLHIHHSAFVIDPASPPSPFYNPYFSEEKGWITVRHKGCLTQVIVKDLGAFTLALQGTTTVGAAHSCAGAEGASATGS